VASHSSIAAAGEAPDLTNRPANASHGVLRHGGNLSSPTVLFVLDYTL